jgi:hypothetical protein
MLTPMTPIVPIDTRRLPRSVPPPPVAPPATSNPEESKPEPADAIETIATRPLERAVRSKPERGRRVASGVALGAAALAVALFAIRAGRPSSSLSSPSSSPSHVAPPATVLLPRPPPPSPAPPANAPAASTAPPTPTPSASASQAPAPAPSSAPLAHLALLADPATRVSIDGTPYGACPIRDLALDPGTHDVRFTFQPTGESSGERLSLRAGERITVRADFSSATPTIRVLR